jgi:hypothetical protein
VIIVVVQVGAVKIYVAAVEALRKKERGGQNRMKLWFTREKKMVLFCVSPGSSSPFPPLNANVLLQVVLNLTRFWTKLRVVELCFTDFTENSNMCN